MDSFLPGQEVQVSLVVRHRSVIDEVKFYITHRDRDYGFQPLGDIYLSSETQGIMAYRIEAEFRITSGSPPGAYELRGADVRTAGGQIAAFGPGEMQALGDGSLPTFVVEEELDKHSITLGVPEFRLYS